MAAVKPNEGLNLLANIIFAGSDVNRGTDLELLLFTNTSVSASTVYANLTEPSGAGYARKALVNASWVIVDNDVTYPTQTFEATELWTGDIYGYAVVTTGTSPKILAVEVDPTGPYTLDNGQSYVVNLNIAVN